MESGSTAQPSKLQYHIMIQDTKMNKYGRKQSKLVESRYKRRWYETVNKYVALLMKTMFGYICTNETDPKPRHLEFPIIDLDCHEDMNQEVYISSRGSNKHSEIPWNGATHKFGHH
ncbi:unnamed protein product [Heterobilharzia americana]|nr:unnamed protein product [Heterobilharzia americana]